MTDPKSMCRCGSGKQHRKCYGANIYDNKCLQFFEDNKHEWTQAIQYHIDSSSLEISEAIGVLREKDKNKFLRSMMLLDCALWETLANIRAYFNGNEDNSASKKSKDYFKLFCYSQLNSEFFSEPYWKNIHVAKLYELRSSLTHFMGLGGNLSLGSHKMLDVHKLKKLIKEGIHLVDPSDFCLLLLVSGKLMIDAINKEGKVPSIEYLEKLKRLYIKIHKEGAVMIDGIS